MIHSACTCAAEMILHGQFRILKLLQSIARDIYSDIQYIAPSHLERRYKFQSHVLSLFGRQGYNNE